MKCGPFFSFGSVSLWVSALFSFCSICLHCIKIWGAICTTQLSLSFSRWTVTKLGISTPHWWWCAVQVQILMLSLHFFTFGTMFSFLNTVLSKWVPDTFPWEHTVESQGALGQTSGLHQCVFREQKLPLCCWLHDVMHHGLWMTESWAQRLTRSSGSAVTFSVYWSHPSLLILVGRPLLVSLIGLLTPVSFYCPAWCTCSSLNDDFKMENNIIYVDANGWTNFSCYLVWGQTSFVQSLCS